MNMSCDKSAKCQTRRAEYESESEILRENQGLS